MTTYAEEKESLYASLKQKIEVLRRERDALRKEGKLKGLDSEFGPKQKDIIREYNERLLALKNKYGIT